MSTVKKVVKNGIIISGVMPIASSSAAVSEPFKRAVAAAVEASAVMSESSETASAAAVPRREEEDPAAMFESSEIAPADVLRRKEELYNYDRSLYKNPTSIENATDFLNKYKAENMFMYDDVQKRFYYQDKTVSEFAFTQLQVLNQLSKKKIYVDEGNIYFKKILTIEEANKFLSDHNASSLFRYDNIQKRFYYIDQKVSEFAFTTIQVLNKMQKKKLLS